MPLTALRVAKAKKTGRYGDGQGLYLQVTNAGVKSWLLRFEHNGRERWMGLGPLHTISLKEARDRARKARQQLLDGIDPLDARKAERAAQALEAARALTFDEATRQYFDQHERKWRNAKHRQQFLNTLATYAFPKIGRLSVAAIDTGLVLKCLEPIWHEKTETANRVRSRIESVLDWATVRGYRHGDNPARWKGHLDNVLPARGQIQKINHHAALPYADLPAFMTALKQREGVAARALEFTILTAARTGEVIGATWDEIDLTAKVWTVPAGRIKGGREHRVPLSDRAVAILKSLPCEDRNKFVFIGPRTGGLSNMAMASVLDRMGCGDVTVHGFRSTFRDWAAESTGYPNHVVEMALAHVIGDKVEAAYRRGDLFDKRRKLMGDWAKFCATKLTIAADIIPLRKAVR
jgi:integrase